MHEPCMSHSLVRTSPFYTSPFCRLPACSGFWCPRSGFWYRGTSAKTTQIWKPPFCKPAIGKHRSAQAKTCFASRLRRHSHANMMCFQLSGSVLRDTARLSQRYPPIGRYGVFGVSTWPIGCDTPSPFSERFPIGEHAKWRCDTPPLSQKGYLSDTCAIPYETKANGCDTPFCDTISKRYCAIWGGISHWAAKVLRGFEKWLAGGGRRLTGAKLQQKIRSPEWCPPSPKRAWEKGCRKMA